MSYVKRVSVTPRIAQKLIDNNYEKNRHVRQSVVDRYASDMSTGLFNPDANGLVVVSKDGKLLDGQHRMLAIIKSGTTYNMDIRFDVEENAYEMIDSGVVRKLSDVITGVNKNNLASVTQSVCLYSKKRFSIQTCLKGGVSYTTKAECIEFYEKNREKIAVASDYARQVRQSLGMGSVKALGFCIYLVLDKYEYVIEYIIEELR